MPISRRAVLAGAGVAALGAGALLYVLFPPASKPADYRRFAAQFAHGPLGRLTSLETPPPQPTRPFRDAAGHEHHLAEFRGGVVLVNLWATVCAPCVTELPTLGALQRHFSGRLRVLAITVDGEGKTAEAKAELARLTGDALAFYEEPTRNILFDTRSASMPNSILYDRRGQEIARVDAAVDWESPEAIAMIEAVLAEP